MKAQRRARLVYGVLGALAGVTALAACVAPWWVGPSGPFGARGAVPAPARRGSATPAPSPEGARGALAARALQPAAATATAVRDALTAARPSPRAEPAAIGTPAATPVTQPVAPTRAATVTAATVAPAPTLTVGTVAPAATAGATAGAVTVRLSDAARGAFAYGVAIADVAEGPGHSYALARQMGFTHAYAVIDWDNVLREDGQPGRYAWERGEPNDLDNVLQAARANGLALVIRLDRPRDWRLGTLSHLDPAVVERFAYGVAARAADVATAYEVLNEPNLPHEWGGPPDPAGYARLLAAARRGIERADPDALVLAAGLSPYTGGQAGSIEDVDFLRGLYAAGASGTNGSFDALAAHAYAGDRPPEADPWPCGMCFRRVERYRRVMDEHGDGATPMWITEFGYLHSTPINLGSYDWMKVSPQLQGERLVAAYRYARAHWAWLRGMVLFNLDFSTTPWNPAHAGAHWFSLLNQDRTARPALRAVGDWLGSPEARR